MFQSASEISHYFARGDYTAIAMYGGKDQWETYAALGLMGKTKEAIEGLKQFSHEESRFYQGVVYWIAGDEISAISELAKVNIAHAKNLLNLINQPKIKVLAQISWQRGGQQDLLTGMQADEKFEIKNISFHPDDLQNKPYANIHDFYDTKNPPHFYLSQMIEWHLIPPNLQELPCPIIGQTDDYDIHAQALYPWLFLFDEMIIGESDGWRDLSQMLKVPVSTFAKTFCIPQSIIPLSTQSRDIDFFVSGTTKYPYNPDKAKLLNSVSRIPNLKIKIVHGSFELKSYFEYLSHSKVTYGYVRRPTYLPSRCLDALAMGCAVVVQKGSVLNLFVGKNEGVLNYSFDKGDLPEKIQYILAHWPEFESRAQKGAEIIRREFNTFTVGSQYLRFVTFLAAKPRGDRHIISTENFDQRRMVKQRGWLPVSREAYETTIKPINCARFHESNKTSNPYWINLAYREFFLGVDGGHCHGLLDNSCQSFYSNLTVKVRGVLTRQKIFIKIKKLIGVLVYCCKPEFSRLKMKCHEKLREYNIMQDIINILECYYRSALIFPNELVLSFNWIRNAFHYGNADQIKNALCLARKTVNSPMSIWNFSVHDDIYTWDYFNSYFDYRKYTDLIKHHFVTKEDINLDLINLIYAALHYYLGYHENSLEHFQAAVELNPIFPFYRVAYAEALMRRHSVGDIDKALDLLKDIALDSILTSEACRLIEYVYRKYRGNHIELSKIREIIKQ